jgi:hypothetical protein
MHDVDDLVDVLVRVGLFFGEASPALRLGDDASRRQLAIDAPPFRLLDRASSTHQTSRSVTGSSERLLHAADLAGEAPARSTHVARNQNRLADYLVTFRDFSMPWWERARRSLAVHPDFF